MRPDAPDADHALDLFDLPVWLRFLKKGRRGIYLYYLLRQLGAARIAFCLHRRIKFDFLQYVTLSPCWFPSLFSFCQFPCLGTRGRRGTLAAQASARTQHPGCSTRIVAVAAGTSCKTQPLAVSDGQTRSRDFCANTGNAGLSAKKRQK